MILAGCKRCTEYVKNNFVAMTGPKEANVHGQLNKYPVFMSDDATFRKKIIYFSI